MFSTVYERLKGYTKTKKTIHGIVEGVCAVKGAELHIKGGLVGHSRQPQTIIVALELDEKLFFR